MYVCVCVCVCVRVCACLYVCMCVCVCVWLQLLSQLNATDHHSTTTASLDHSTTTASLDHSTTTDAKTELLQRLQVAKKKKLAVSVARADVSSEVYEMHRCCSLVEQHLNAHFHAQAKLNDELDSGEWGSE